jgi:bifunctional UDP-N-acetylglucosamine pyrophosphorylase/glucosamine-1-phosphate N-acetyltransferase
VNLERYYQRQIAQKLAYSGVTIFDQNRVDIRGTYQIGPETSIDINVVMEGHVVIGPNCEIGPNVYLKDVELGAGVKVMPNSVIEGAKIGDHCEIGPFARIRPQTIIENEAKVGNFVEMKKTILGRGSKANHLTYLGDAIIGADVNIGAGTITCNYDGTNKFTTIIKDGVFIGSNSSLIAPITITENAFIAAGSTINQDVTSEGLTIARAKQKTLEKWKRPAKDKKKQKSSEKI